jgi:hypothetical protein
MKFREHRTLFLLATAAWILLWLGGWPHYYQQYSMLTMAVLSVLLSVVFALIGVAALMRVASDRRPAVAFWLSFYFTVPFALYDGWYCGVHLDRGLAYLHEYWYLTVFYGSLWLTFLPIAWVLNGRRTKRKFPVGRPEHS